MHANVFFEIEMRQKLCSSGAETVEAVPVNAKELQTKWPLGTFKFTAKMKSEDKVSVSFGFAVINYPVKNAWSKLENLINLYERPWKWGKLKNIGN